MKENQSNYEDMSLRGRRDFLQSLIGLAAVAVLPVPVGIILGQKPAIMKQDYIVRYVVEIDGDRKGDREGWIYERRESV